MKIVNLIFVCFVLLSCKQPDVNPTSTSSPSHLNQAISGLRFLALGDSYTIGQSVEEEDRWPNQLAKKLENFKIEVDEVDIIAQTGWTTSNLKNAISVEKPDSNYDMVALLIGVNNQFQGRSIEEYSVEFEELLVTAIALAKGDKNRVFVVSIPDYGYTPFGAASQENISKALDKFNAVNEEITKRHKVDYHNITDISREGLDDPSLVASDKLHPSGQQYRQWVARFDADVASQIKKW